MSKRIIVTLSEEAWKLVLKTKDEVNGTFGRLVSPSMVVEEMILHSKVDVKVMQSKHVDLHQLLRSLYARPDLDIDEAARAINDFRSKGNKRRSSPSTEEGD